MGREGGGEWPTWMKKWFLKAHLEENDDSSRISSKKVTSMR